MKNLGLAFFFVAVLSGITPAQSNKPWFELTRKEAQKVLNDSPWAQTQVETDTSEMFFTPTKIGAGSIELSSARKAATPASEQQSINNNRTDRGALNQPISVFYRVRLLSARPVREAISQMIVIDQEKRYEGLVDQMQTFVDRDFSQFIVVVVTFDSSDARFSGPALQAFGSATREVLRNGTFLERKDGKRLYLLDYRAPTEDGLGAKFVFPRLVDGKPFIDVKDGSVRFYSDVLGKVKLNVRYRLADMLVGGKLEY